MKKQSITTDVYISEDGKEFLTEKECLNHEDKMKSILHFKVSAYPDTTEGRMGPKHVGCIAVCAQRHHEMFAEFACFSIFGNRVTFVQGTFGSNAIMPNWKLDKTPSKNPQGKVIATVQDKFSKTKVFKEGLRVIKG